MTTTRRMKVEAFPGGAGGKELTRDGRWPEWRWWYWRIRWENGKIAAVSEGYEQKATAVRLARKLAEQLRCDFELPIPLAARGKR